MMRIGIYARYSTDMQSLASIEDQIRLCTERAKREGWKVVNCYTDHATSGASMMRPGLQMLMQDVAVGKLDLVLAEALDRISRDQEDIAGIFKRLCFAGARIVTLSEGDISHLHIGLKGTMNALFLKDLADKTRRGLRGRVENGKSGGGNCFGYDVVYSPGPRDDTARGERKINEEQARVVERIFREYLAGHSPKAIAQRLNREGVKGPTGNGWGPSTIHGNRQRGTGILNNELYIGRLVWNRLRYIKDPDTGKRVSRLNPEDEWVTAEVPEMRIIDQELWDAVKAKQGKINHPKKAFHEKQRPKNLFSYLIKCGECGGGCSMVSQTHIGCSNARNKGTCDNRLTVAREKLETAVLGALTDHLMDPELCAAFCEDYRQHANRLRQEHNAALDGYRREHEMATQELDRLIDQLLAGVPTERVKDRMQVLEDRRAEIKRILETTEEAPVLFHPQMADRYHQEVQQLIAALNYEDHRAEAADLLRGLIDKIVLMPDSRRERLSIDLVGDLAGILSMATAHERSLVGNDLANMQDKMVAGTGFGFHRLNCVEELILPRYRITQPFSEHWH